MINSGRAFGNITLKGEDRDVLAIGKFETIPERPVQSGPVQAGYLVTGSVLVSFLSYGIVGKAQAESSRLTSLQHVALRRVVSLSSAYSLLKAFPTIIEDRKYTSIQS